VNGLPAAVIIEAVQAVSGVIGPNVDFLRGVRDLASRHDVPLVLDEIWNGFGRTGRWFGFQHAGIEPDMVVMGKGLSAGLPLSGVAAGERLLKAWPPGMHTSTFQGNPAACAMAVATIDVISGDNLLSHVSSVVAPALEAALSTLLGRPGIAAVRVAGAQAAIQFHREGLPDGNRSSNLQRRLLNEELLVYGGGRQSDCLMLLPPINIKPEVLQPALTRIVEAVRSEP
jgi:4-aminobutyrate aminotransferase-like enzyme